MATRNWKIPKCYQINDYCRRINLKYEINFLFFKKKRKERQLSCFIALLYLSMLICQKQSSTYFSYLSDTEKRERLGGEVHFNYSALKVALWLKKSLFLFHIHNHFRVTVIQFCKLLSLIIWPLHSRANQFNGLSPITVYYYKCFMNIVITVLLLKLLRRNKCLHFLNKSIHSVPLL